MCPSHHGVRLGSRRINVRDAMTKELALRGGNPNCDLTVATVPAGTARFAHGVRWCEIPFLSSFSPYCHAAAFVAPKSVQSNHMRCNTTAILRASATRAFLKPARLASLAPQLFRGLALRERVSIIWAAS